MLDVNQIKKNFSGLEVLKEVTFKVTDKENHAIIGPNGAGKTTLFNIISGKFRPTSGSVVFKGTDITHKPAHIRNRMKLSRSFQITNVFHELSVFDNVIAGVRCQRGMRYNFFKSPLSNNEICSRATEIIEEVGLEEVMHTKSRELSYGQQRALEIGVTLSTEPELLLLDEPTAGMTREETAEAIELIQKVTSDKSLLIIEHDMDVVFTLADTISVLHYGTILASDTPENIRNDQRVKDAYLGEEEE